MIQILVVEDERPISNLIAVNLRKAGYSCRCVYDGMAAADALDKARYDLILLDVMLPKVDGYELMNYITPLEIPVIFLTGRRDPESMIKVMPLKPAGYLIKSSKPAEIKKEIDTFFEKKKAKK